MTLQRLELGAISLAYQASGPQGGARVVFVHEAASGRFVWDQVITALDADIEAVAYDRRGYGESTGPQPFATSTIEEHAEDLAGLIRTLQATRRTIVCGHGVGAVVCMDCLRRHAELVDAAVLIEPQLFALARQGSEAVADLREALASGARTGGRLEAFIQFARELDGDRLLALLEGQSEVMAKLALAAAADLQATTRWHFAGRDFAQIGHPTVVVAGSRSTAVYIEVCEALARALPRAGLATADGGHFAVLEAPVAIAEAIRSLVGGA